MKLLRRTALSVLLVSLLIAATTFATKAYRHSIPPVKSRAITLTPEKSAPSALVKTAAETSAQGKAAYGKLPLTFELNQGQADQQVKFLSRGKGYNLFLTGTEAALNLRRGEGRRGDGARRGEEDSGFRPHPSSFIPYQAATRACESKSRSHWP